MAKPIIDDQEFQKNLNAMVDTLAERAEAFQRFVVASVAEQVMTEIQDRAPKNDPDLPPNYAKDLIVTKVEGRDASYAVVYHGSGDPGSHYDPVTTVLYIKLVDSGANDPETTLFRQLARLGPFTMDTMPLDVPRDTGFVLARTVSEVEVDQIRKRAGKQKARIDAVVERYGKGVTNRIAFDANKAAIFNDLGFQILRKEFGLGISKHPHWRPALKVLRDSDAFLNGLQKSSASKRLWNDPNDTGWKKLGTVEHTATGDAADSLHDFQEKLLPQDRL